MQNSKGIPELSDYQSWSLTVKCWFPDVWITIYIAAVTSSLFLLQTNKFNKTADRAVLFTDKFIYKLDPKKGFKPMKAAIPITDVSKL